MIIKEYNSRDFGICFAAVNVKHIIPKDMTCKKCVGPVESLKITIGKEQTEIQTSKSSFVIFAI